MSDEGPIYESDPSSAPDSDFAPACIERLTTGVRGRLLDVRRTPVTVVGVLPERAAFVVRVDAFEDAGATWELFLGELHRFQFNRDAPLADGTQVRELKAAVERCDQELVIEAAQHRGRMARQAVTDRRRAVAQRLDTDWSLSPDEISGLISRREGKAELFAALEKFLEEEGLATLERELLVPLISNPRSGEMVKGHAIVLAELGLCSYRGQAVRDPDLFNGRHSKEVRAEHILWRMALTQELWGRVSGQEVFRAFASEGPERLPTTDSLVSATFSEDVARSHYEGSPTTRTRALLHQVLPVDRLFMTFIETRAMNERFREAEALLLGSPETTAF